jgi:transposase-like protein
MYEEMTPEAFKMGWIQHKIDTNQSAAEVARKFGLKRKTVNGWFCEYKKIQDSLGSKESQ